MYAVKRNSVEMSAPLTVCLEKRPRTNNQQDTVEDKVHHFVINHSEKVLNLGLHSNVKRNLEKREGQDRFPKRPRLHAADAEKRLMRVHVAGSLCQRFLERVSDVYAGKISMIVVRNCYSLITYLALHQDGELLRFFRPLIEVRNDTGCTPLIQFAQQGDIESVRQLQQAGALINAQDSTGLTALMHAAEKPDIELIKKLKELGADFEKRDHAGCTALMRAAAQHEIELVRTLWRGGANIEAQDNTGYTALMRAAANNDLELVKNLAFIGPRLERKEINRRKAVLQLLIVREKIFQSDLNEIVNEIKEQNHENVASLMRAAYHRQLDFDKKIFMDTNEKFPLMSYLIKETLEVQNTLSSLLSSINKYVQDKNNEIQSVDENLSRIVIKWIKHMTTITSQIYSMGASIEAKDARGYTSLMRAAQKGDTDLVSKLLALGADIEAQDRKGATALMHAARREDTQMVRFLIQTGKANIEAKNHEGQTALMCAAVDEVAYMVQYLHHMGADIDAHDIDGDTALSRAAASCVTADTKNMFHLLIKLGANEEFAKEVIKRRLLAHVMGVEGKSVLENKKTKKNVEIDLEGMNHLFAFKKIIENAQFFFKHFAAAIDEKTQKIILEALKQPVYDSENTERGFVNFEAGKPVVISAGSQHHRICMVLRKDPHRHNTAQLSICNRGDGKREHAVEHYVLPVEKVSKKMLEKFITFYEDIEDFYEVLEGMHLNYEGGFDQKEQKIGNCSWSSAKGAFGILCRLYVGSNVTEGNKAYKAFTKYTRARAIAFYEKWSQQPEAQCDLNLLETCKKKFFVKFPASITAPAPMPASSRGMA